jgi:hypothetical protein
MIEKSHGEYAKYEQGKKCKGEYVKKDGGVKEERK